MALTIVENKIPNVSNVVKETGYNRKITETENKITADDQDKYIATQEFNKLISENLTARLKQASLASKSDIANSIKKQIWIIN